MKLRILLVEDDEDTRELVASFLRDLGVEIREARDGVEAEGQLQGWTPSLILSDIGLPLEDGVALLLRLRRTHPRMNEVPAVAMTAYSTPEDRKRTAAAGFRIHLPKPLNLDALMQTLAGFV